MEIVEVVAGIGVNIKSRLNAMKYVDKYNTGKNLRALKADIYELIEEREKLNQRISEKIDHMFDLSERLKHTNPINIMEFEVPLNSPLIGKMIVDVQFWQKTGATIVGIKREDKFIISPGPYACFMPQDIILVIGDTGILRRVEAIMNEG
jgi:K+/H+ antiporter YhaU regulatory subunit KhtT